MVGTRLPRAFYADDRPTLADIVLAGKPELACRHASVGDLASVPGGLAAENWCTLPTGRRLYLTIAAGPLFNIDGSTAAVIETLHDMTAPEAPRGRAACGPRCRAGGDPHQGVSSSPT
ncbi:MAG: hypothetical protein R3F45_13345 [Gammaproteobacteria bacterium]